MPIIPRGNTGNVNAEAMALMSAISQIPSGAEGFGRGFGALMRRNQQKDELDAISKADDFFMRQNQRLANGVNPQQTGARAYQAATGEGGAWDDPQESSGDHGFVGPPMLPVMQGEEFDDAPSQQVQGPPIAQQQVPSRRPAQKWEPEFHQWSQSVIDDGRKFAETLTPAGRVAFGRQLRGYLQDAEVTAATRGTVDRYQDTLLGLKQAAGTFPEAEMFAAELDALSAQIDMLDDPGMDAASRAKLIDAFNKKMDTVVGEFRKEVRTNRNRESLLVAMQARADLLPVGHPEREDLLNDIALLSLRGVDPTEYAMKMALKDQGMVEHEFVDPSGEVRKAWVTGAYRAQILAQDNAAAKLAASRLAAKESNLLQQRGSVRKAQIEARAAAKAEYIKNALSATRSQDPYAEPETPEAYKARYGKIVEGWEQGKKGAATAKKSEEEIIDELRKVLGSSDAAPSVSAAAPDKHEGEQHWLMDAPAEDGAASTGPMRPAEAGRTSKAFDRIKAAASKKAAPSAVLIMQAVSPFIPEAKRATLKVQLGAALAMKATDPLNWLRMLSDLPAAALEKIADELEGK